MRRLIAIFITMSLACSAPIGGRETESAREAAASAAQRSRPVIDHLEPKPDSTGRMPSRFRWTAIDGAEQYVISLWSDADVLLWRQYLAGTEVPWPKPLELEEGTYFWMVSALRGDQLIADSGRAAFVVLNRP